MKKMIAFGLALIMSLTLLAGCGGGSGSDTTGTSGKDTQAPKTTGEKTTQAPADATQAPATDAGAADAPAVNEDLEGTLTFAIWDNTAQTLYDELDLVGRFQEIYPNADIEIEKLKDDSEYWNAMKMRASADELPDVMFNKTFTLSRFQEYLVDLSGLEATKNNLYAEGYATNGKILGLPSTKTQEYVYYWKDMFKEAGVEVPTTWSDFIDVSKKLQEYYGKDNANFAAIGLGGKDEWVTYPFMEYMPALESGNGQNWNDMAKQDAPFAEGTDVYKAYMKANDLFTSGVFGKDPLGIGNDQAVSLFAQKQSAMIALGGWGLVNITDGADSVDELGTFYLPSRDSKSDPFRTITQGDCFMSVTTCSKNPELAKAFVEFYFSDAWYPEYVAAIADDSTMATAPKEKAPILAQADELAPDAEVVLYDGGGDDFTAIVSETTFDYKKLGCQMLVNGFDLQGTLDELNTKWTAARAKLGIQ